MTRTSFILLMTFFAPCMVAFFVLVSSLVLVIFGSWIVVHEVILLCNRGDPVRESRYLLSDVISICTG